MMKKSGFFVATLFISMLGFSQSSIKANIEKQAKDPRNADNAAKADVYILGNEKKISDTTAGSVNNQNQLTKGSRKKKRCSRKT